MSPDATRDMIGEMAESEQPTETRLHLEKILIVPQEQVFAALDPAGSPRRRP
jgi:hypothetical protein